MYFPYLRGKQHEVFAVAESAPVLAAKGVVLPVFEPVSSVLSQLPRIAGYIEELGLRYAIIANPRVGKLVAAPDIVRDRILAPSVGAGPGCIPAFIIDPGVQLHHVQAFLNRYADRPVMLIHKTSFQQGAGIHALVNQAGNVEHHLFAAPGTSVAYRGLFPSTQSAILQDPFVRKPRNADYAAASDEHFTSEHLTFADDDLIGFADYTIVGNHFMSGTGGAAHAVCTHLTYPAEDGSVWVRHFVSDDTQTSADQEGKTLQSIAKAVAFAEAHGELGFSPAVAAWSEAISPPETPPQLGMLKRLAIRHHLELIDQLL